MNQALLDAKAELAAAGLSVKQNGETALWITATSQEIGGLTLSKDASALLQRDGEWIAVFPTPGTLSYEVPGSLPDLTSLILKVYAHYRRFGGSFDHAFERSVPASESFLVGRFPAEDRPSHKPTPLPR